MLGIELFEHRDERVALAEKEPMVERIIQPPADRRLDDREVHYPPDIVQLSSLAGELSLIPVTMGVSTLALMLEKPVSCIELENASAS
jgi:hypothetical protein